MMLRDAALILVVAASVGPADAGGAGRGKPTLEQALERAKVVAFGQIQKLEQRDGRTISTMQVEHLARGEAPPLLTYSVDPLGGFQLSAKVGDRELVFLEASGSPDVPLKTAFAGAVLAAFQRGGEIYVAASHRGVQLPLGLCELGEGPAPYSCVAKLHAVLGFAGLRPMFPKDTEPATFRITSWTCAPCELGAWMEKSSTEGAADCGSTSLKSNSSNAMACVRYALAAKKPFRVVLQLQGTDSLVQRGFVSDGVTAFELTFDGNVEGGFGSCAARIERRRCRSLQLQKPQVGDWLGCVEPGEGEALCAQRSDRVESLSPPRSVEDLRCDKNQGSGSFFDCAVRPGSSRSSKSVPSSNGPDLICRPMGRLVDQLICEAK